MPSPNKARFNHTIYLSALYELFGVSLVHLFLLVNGIFGINSPMPLGFHTV